MALAQFPEWSSISPEVKPEIDAIAAPYRCSDPTFANLFAWDTDQTGRVARLGDNLVTLIPDYMDSAPTLSLVGGDQAIRSARTLLQWASEEKVADRLQLVPEATAQALRDAEDLQSQPDADNHDYVLSVRDVAERQGRQYDRVRYGFNRFENRYGSNSVFEELDLRHNFVHKEILRVFMRREMGKQGDPVNEYVALNRMFANISALNLRAFGLRHNEHLIGFMILEPQDAEWNIGHFWKADTRYEGVYTHLMVRICEQLKEEGIRWLNIEQDLGLPGLRHAKRQFRPTCVLKKYVVRAA